MVGDEATSTYEQHARAQRKEALRMQRRCPSCAERVGVEVLLRGAACPHCGVQDAPEVLQDPDSLLGPLERRWRWRRLALYGVLAVGTFLTGALPFVATLLTVVFVVAMRYALIREPLQWLRRSRRFTSRFTLRLWLLVTTLLTLLGNELLTFAPGVNMPLKMVVSVVGALLYTEGSLWFLRNRVRREARDPALQWWEWGLPALLLGTLALLGGSCFLVLHLLQRALDALMSGG